MSFPRRLSFASFLVLNLAACAATESTNSAPQSAEVNATSPGTAALPNLESLTSSREIIKAVFDEQIRHSPINAMYAGVRDFDAVVDDLSQAEAATFYARMNVLAKKLATIDPSTLSPSEELAFDVALASVKNAHGREVAHTELWEISSFWDTSDVPTDFAYVRTLETVADVDNMVARYHEIPRYLRQRTDNLKTGAAAHLVAAQPVIRRGLENTKNNTPTAAAGSPFSALTFGDDVSEEDKAAWQARIDAIVDAEVAPAYQKYAEFLENELLPQGRTTFGAGALGENGLEYYRSQIAFFTGSSQTPEELLDLGVVRVTELETELRTELAAFGITEPTISASLQKLAALPESTATLSVAEVTDYSKAFLAKLDSAPWASSVWGVRSDAPPEVDVKDRSGTAYYTIGTNTMTIFAKGTHRHDLDWMLTHEFTHFLQDTVSHQASAEPPVTPYLSVFGGSAMSEGGAHYAETLALRAGLYNQPSPRDTALRKIAALGGLMLRAVRLVVDTSIHVRGMDRDTAIAYMKDRVSMPVDNIAHEVDRYASWPAQALAYRVGMEGIASERARAERALGSRFSESEFNRLTLSLSGGSLQVLSHRVDRMIASASKP